MVASYCPLDSRADRGVTGAASIARGPTDPADKKETCDWCDADR